MKKLLSKVFFVSDCAQGAAFAMTLFVVGNVLWFSLFHLLTLGIGKITLPLAVTWCVGTLLISCHGLALAIVAMVGLVKDLRRERRSRALWYLLPAGLCLAAGIVGAVRTFPPVAIFDMGFERRYPWSWLSVGFPGLPPQCSAAVFGFSLLLIFAGGLLLTEMFAAAEGKKLRSTFGPALLTLWGAFILWYFGTLGAALYASRGTAKVQQAVERRFGRPLTAEGLAALYRENGKPDAAFWARQEKLRDALPKVKVEADLFPEEHPTAFHALQLPDRPAPETLAWHDRYCRENRAAIEAWERCFDREPPPPEKRFARGGLVAVLLPELSVCRDLARMERGRLIRGLAAGDVETAWTCYWRMNNVTAFLRKAPWLQSSLTWMRLEHERLDWVEKMLASRLLSDARLEELDADFAALERAIPRNHRQALYSEAVFSQDILVMFADEPIEIDRARFFAPFAPYRWIFPQFWLHAALDRRNMLRSYLQPDLAHGQGSVPQKPVFLLSSMLLPALENIGYRFYALTARVRGMRALIRAEKYRRQHGEFPKTMTDLPEDPFTGRPLIYEIGPTEIVEIVWKKTVDFAAWEKRTVDAVQVHSDPAALPENIRRYPGKGTDLTRAVLRK